MKCHWIDSNRCSLHAYTDQINHCILGKPILMLTQSICNSHLYCWAANINRYFTMKTIFTMLLLMASTGIVWACDETNPRDDVWVIANQNSAKSMSIANYYADQRCLNKNNIIPVYAPVTYELTDDQYVAIRAQITDFLVKRFGSKNAALNNNLWSLSSSDCEATRAVLRPNLTNNYNPAVFVVIEFWATHSTA